MARQAKVRTKNGYWYSEAGGVGRYLGRCDEVTQTQAMSLLYEALTKAESVRLDWIGEEGIAVESVRASGRKERKIRPEPHPKGEFFPSFPNANAESNAHIPNPNPYTQSKPNPTFKVNDLRNRYLEWLKRHRSDRLHDESQRHLKRWCEAYGGMEAVTITGSHLEAFTDSLDEYAPLYVKKHATTIRTMFSRGVITGWLPEGFKPFARVEGIKIDPKPLLETDLPTEAKVQAIREHAGEGLMADVVAVYHATGCRTHELIEARVGDFQSQSRTIVLGRHKRSKTMKAPIPRTITLNPSAYAILERRCQEKNAGEHIIVNRNGQPYDSRTLANRFQSLREKAGVRTGITIYSFRHLWISEALMAGLDSLIVARMAGTSIAMIESVYGHFRTSSYQDAQAKLDAMRASM